MVGHAVGLHSDLDNIGVKAAIHTQNLIVNASGLTRFGIVTNANTAATSASQGVNQAWISSRVKVISEHRRNWVAGVRE
jgi:hypothetical protein